jgi:hypothetical protein
MKKLLVVMALLLIASFASAQILGEQTYIYRMNKIVKNTYDTIPTYNNVAGYTGWIYVGNANVNATLTALDSVNLEWSVDWADSGSGVEAGNAKVYAHMSRAHAVGEDTVYSKTALTTGNSAMYSKTYRDHAAGINLIPGGKWVRFIVHATNTDEQALAAAKTYVYRFTVRTWQGD